MGYLGSEFLLEPKVREYFRLVAQRDTHLSLSKLLMSPLCLVFYFSQLVYLACFLLIDHELPPEQIRIAKVTCGVDI